MKDIPEAGVERDKLIAQLSGWQQVKDIPRNEMNVLCPEHSNLLRSDSSTYRDYWVYKTGVWCEKISNSDWSTSRNDAWKLWDEMKASTPILNYQIFDNNHLVNNAHSIDNQIMTISEEGKSFADVVSKAWIRWKMRDMSITRHGLPAPGNG